MHCKNYFQKFISIIAIIASLLQLVNCGGDGNENKPRQGISLDNWQASYPLPLDVSLHSLGYGNGMFVGAGGLPTFGHVMGSEMIFSSPNGKSWTKRFSSGTSNSLFDISYGHGIFIIPEVRSESSTIIFDIITSYDGISWTRRPSEPISSVTYGNGIFVAAGSDGNISTSSVGIIWTQRFSGNSYNIFHLGIVVYGNGTFVAAGYNGTYEVIITSADGIVWTPTPLSVSSQFFSITYGNDTFVAVGKAGIIYTSPDGISWTQRSSGTSNHLLGVTYGYDTFVAVGYGGTLLTSPDGISWTQRSSGTSNHLSDVAYGKGTFVVVGSGGIVLQPARLEE